MAGRPPDPMRVAAILAYAMEHGDAKAAKKFKIARRTVRSYRARRKQQPDLDAACLKAAEKVQVAWLDEARSARSKLLAMVLEKAAQEGQSLRDLVGALKIVNDGTLAYEVVNPDGGRTGDGAGMAGSGGPPAGAEGDGDPGRTIQ